MLPCNEGRVILATALLSALFFLVGKRKELCLALPHQQGRETDKGLLELGSPSTTASPVL